MTALVPLWAVGAAAAAQSQGSTPIEVENARAGTTDWLVPAPSRREISGYVDDVSYAPGETVRLFVSSRGAGFSFQVYRMGYYGNTGGRLVLGPVDVATNAPQPRDIVKGDRTEGPKLLLSRWRGSARFTIPRDWVSGFYLVRLTNAANGAESYAHFIVRGTEPAPVVVVFPTNTWQAYNSWGGLSLYRDKRTPPPGVLRTRAHRVSFLRPSDKGHGAGFFWSSERPLVHWLEERGYPVSYASDRDTLLGRLVGPQTRLVILSGHAEYHSMTERDVYTGLERRGISLAIFGGNTFVTQARFTPSGDVMTVWRHRHLDRVKGRRATVRWELAGWPQNRLTGTMGGAGEIGPLAAVATNHWAWNGAHVANGRLLGPVLGNEQDGIVLNPSTPRRLEILARAKGELRRGHARIADVVLIPGRRGTFVFNGAQNWFPRHLSYPPYPGVDAANWIGRHYPESSQATEPMRRLADNLISRATGLPNREPSRPPRARVLPHLSIRAPSPTQRLPVGRPIVVLWSSVPSGTRAIRIYVDGRRQASVSSARTTATVPGVRAPGYHRLDVIAAGRGGRVLKRSRALLTVVARRNKVFRVWSPYGLLWRAWA